jgi:transposase
MRWTQKQYERIKHLLPVQRGNVAIDNLTFLRALHYITKNGCCWRDLPEKFGQWFIRFRRWIDLSIFDLIEKELQTQVIDKKGVTALA